MCRWFFKSDVKSYGLTVKVHLKLDNLSLEEESGILSVAVKCVDIEKNTGGESGSLL